jgi:ADP-ribosylation factor-like protein 5B
MHEEYTSLCLQCVILVIDSTDRERLGTSKEELYRMLTHEVCLVRSCLRQPFFLANRPRRYLIRIAQSLQDLRGVSLLILANKQDLEGAMSAAEISEYLNLTSIKDHGWHIQPCSGLTGDGYGRYGRN